MGGTHEVALRICFQVPATQTAREGEWCAVATFHEAEIQVDAILSYPWTEEAKIGVFPHLEALAHLSAQPGESPIHLMDSWPEEPEPEGGDDAEDLETKLYQARKLNLVVPGEAVEWDDDLQGSYEDILEERPVSEEQEVLEEFAVRLTNAPGPVPKHVPGTTPLLPAHQGWTR